MEPKKPNPQFDKLLEQYNFETPNRKVLSSKTGEIPTYRFEDERFTITSAQGDRIVFSPFTGVGQYVPARGQRHSPTIQTFSWNEVMKHPPTASIPKSGFTDQQSRAAVEQYLDELQPELTHMFRQFRANAAKSR